MRIVRTLTLPTGMTMVFGCSTPTDRAAGSGEIRDDVAPDPIAADAPVETVIRPPRAPAAQSLPAPAAQSLPAPYPR